MSRQRQKLRLSAKRVLMSYNLRVYYAQKTLSMA
jgi:hypothetical protein